jgi:hypothetical protein
MSLNEDDKVVLAFRHRGPKPFPSIDFPDITPTGIIRPTCANTRIAINKLAIVCEYDQFHDKLLIGGHAIERYAGELSDHACLVLRQMIDEQFHFDPGRHVARDACIQLCVEKSYAPIVEYLDGLEWDGVDRINKWLTTYLGAEDTELNRTIGRIALIAQVRRARQPGCKFDQIIVLEGAEGIEKSTALQALAGGPDNFSDQTILGRGDKEQQELLRGVWLYEIADLSNIRKAEVEDVKPSPHVLTTEQDRPTVTSGKIDRGAASFGPPPTTPNTSSRKPATAAFGQSPLQSFD